MSESIEVEAGPYGVVLAKTLPKDLLARTIPTKRVLERERQTLEQMPVNTVEESRAISARLTGLSHMIAETFQFGLYSADAVMSEVEKIQARVEKIQATVNEISAVPPTTTPTGELLQQQLDKVREELAQAKQQARITEEQAKQQARITEEQIQQAQASAQQETASLNAEIERLKKEVRAGAAIPGDLQSRLDTVELALATAQGKNAVLVSELKADKTEISDLESELKAAETEISDLKIRLEEGASTTPAPARKIEPIPENVNDAIENSLAIHPNFENAPVSEKTLAEVPVAMRAFLVYVPPRDHGSISGTGTKTNLLDVAASKFKKPSILYDPGKAIAINVGPDFRDTGAKVDELQAALVGVYAYVEVKYKDASNTEQKTRFFFSKEVDPEVTDDSTTTKEYTQKRKKKTVTLDNRIKPTLQQVFTLENKLVKGGNPVGLHYKTGTWLRDAKAVIEATESVYQKDELLLALFGGANKTWTGVNAHITRLYVGSKDGSKGKQATQAYRDALMTTIWPLAVHSETILWGDAQQLKATKLKELAGQGLVFYITHRNVTGTEKKRLVRMRLPPPKIALADDHVSAPPATKRGPDDAGEQWKAWDEEERDW